MRQQTLLTSPGKLVGFNWLEKTRSGQKEKNCCVAQKENSNIRKNHSVPIQHRDE